MARTSSSTAGRQPSLEDGRLRLPDGRRRRSVSRRRPRRYRPSPPAEAFTTLPLTSRTVGAGAVLAEALCRRRLKESLQAHVGALRTS